ncbi:hypothetical protein JCM5296_001841 [Sporobolomyces johnsonii]
MPSNPPPTSATCLCLLTLDPYEQRSQTLRNLDTTQVEIDHLASGDLFCMAWNDRARAVLDEVSPGADKLYDTITPFPSLTSTIAALVRQPRLYNPASWSRG